MAWRTKSSSSEESLRCLFAKPFPLCLESESGKSHTGPNPVNMGDVEIVRIVIPQFFMLRLPTSEKTAFWFFS